MSQDTFFWISAVSLPLVAGLQRYATTYGYRGATRAQACGEAWRTAKAMAVVCGLFAVAKLGGHL